MHLTYLSTKFGGFRKLDSCITDYYIKLIAINSIFHDDSNNNLLHIDLIYSINRFLHILKQTVS